MADEPTIREVLEWAHRARMFMLQHCLVTEQSRDAVDAVNWLERLARRGLDAPRAEDLRWGIRNDPIANAAYQLGRQAALERSVR